MNKNSIFGLETTYTLRRCLGINFSGHWLHPINSRDFTFNLTLISFSICLMTDMVIWFLTLNPPLLNISPRYDIWLTAPCILPKLEKNDKLTFGIYSKCRHDISVLKYYPILPSSIMQKISNYNFLWPRRCQRSHFLDTYSNLILCHFCIPMIY